MPHRSARFRLVLPCATPPNVLQFALEDALRDEASVDPVDEVGFVAEALHADRGVIAGKCVCLTYSPDVRVGGPMTTMWETSDGFLGSTFSRSSLHSGLKRHRCWSTRTHPPGRSGSSRWSTTPCSMSFGATRLTSASRLGPPVRFSHSTSQVLSLSSKRSRNTARPTFGAYRYAESETGAATTSIASAP